MAAILCPARCICNAPAVWSDHRRDDGVMMGLEVPHGCLLARTHERAEPAMTNLRETLEFSA
jgi:hypothetical protein